MTKKARSLYCWKQYCKWRKRREKAEDKTRYWLEQHTKSQLP